MSEDSTNERIELTEQDELDLALLHAEDGGTPPKFHTVLEVWHEVLAPAEKLSKEKVTPQYANKMVQSYAELTFADCAELQHRYFAKLQQLADILAFEIESDEKCLGYTKPEEDAVENAEHYKALLLTWQQAFLQWELEWTCTDDDAAIEIAAISEVHKMFFGQTGLTAFLDNIGFEYTEADQEVLAEVLEEQRAAAGVSGE